MNTICFSTPEEIDPISWSLMGINAKPDSKNPIGHFGTGLKMAIAVLLRTGHQIEVHSGTKHYVFGTEQTDFRGKEFMICTCNGERLPYTTELGKEWEVWMAYRELVSNTMDENGVFGPERELMFKTHIVVIGEEIAKCYKNHDDYFIGQRKVLASSKGLQIYNGHGTYFYKGVRVGQGEAHLYSYNIDRDVPLTEDRTIKSTADYIASVQYGIVNLEDRELIRKFVTAKEGTKERNFGYYYGWGTTFKEVVEQIWKDSPTKLTPAIQRQIKSNLPDAEFKKMEMGKEYSSRLKKALEFLKKAGYEVTSEIVFIGNQDKNNYAFVHNGIIHLTDVAFSKGTFDLISTLLEEHLHTQGFMDETRLFERHLLDEIVRMSSKITGIEL